MLFNVGAYQPLTNNAIMSHLSSQNAGINAPQIPIEDLWLSKFQQVVNVNLVGTFLCTREAVRVFKSQSPPGGECPAWR